eukprot:TRINITY_DN3535_c0_g1_i1.p1 TRINITY_DN3535_c0_g1~~TRINITY_DN3535_c0_g1_i1.p1  ORF type:complete len:225 (+),score=30.26 TRINITY_DN3535_c0_g1_i1:84-677(+)
MARSAAALLLLTILSAAVTAFGEAPDFKLESVTFLGSGCNWTNSDYAISNHGKVVTFMFGGMVATTDSGLMGKRKNCVISFGLKYPKGWSFTVTKVTGRGYADLDGGVTGTYQTSHFVSGQRGTGYLTRVVEGPLEADYEFTDYIEDGIWTECGSTPNTNLNVEVRVDGPSGANGLMTVDTVDHKFKLLYFFSWRRC